MVFPSLSFPSKTNQQVGCPSQEKKDEPPSVGFFGAAGPQNPRARCRFPRDRLRHLDSSGQLWLLLGNELLSWQLLAGIQPSPREGGWRGGAGLAPLLLFSSSEWNMYFLLGGRVFCCISVVVLLFLMTIIRSCYYSHLWYSYEFWGCIRLFAFGVLCLFQICYSFGDEPMGLPFEAVGSQSYRPAIMKVF